MKTTAAVTTPAPYLGADLTDRHSRGRRPIDVCGLWPQSDGTLLARFWRWTWPESRQALQVAAIAAEIGASRAAMLDAPQALASPGRRLRAAERACRAAGKTPDDLANLVGPYAGFVRSSVELFAALHACGVTISPTDCLNGASEYYPGDAWLRLAGERLPRKNTRAGRQMRRELLTALGVTGLPSLPSHDENDACLGALLAAAADARIPSLAIELAGEPLTVDSDGHLREGPIAVPRTNPALACRIRSRSHDR